MAKPGGNKKRCEKYAKSGHKELNKKLRQERDKKLKAKFAKRREEGKAYEYKPIPYEKDTPEYNKEAKLRKSKTEEYHKTEFQRWKSIFTKLDNEIEREKRAEKFAT